MKHTAFIAVVLTGAISLTTGVAMARDDVGRAPVSFELLDTDGDGAISRAEADAPRLERITGADTDGDGFLTAEEISQQGAERMKDRSARMIERLDTDGDGRLSMEELSTSKRADKRFDRADANDDGTISKEEFEEARARFAGKRHGGGRDRN
ncbi:calcium-binding protein [uncultured Roseobacter sp.]|uniref:EF-hand domain-containing protein n=1 Tax=uncultured Roseobacter sp. TaxID=114847 RepID=UPI002622B845|nr:calcium-binding protein [uncultured Roseobacter sp.]